MLANGQRWLTNIARGPAFPGFPQHSLVCGAHLVALGRAHRVGRVANGVVWPATQIGSLIHTPNGLLLPHPCTQVDIRQSTPNRNPKS